MRCWPRTANIAILSNERSISFATHARIERDLLIAIDDNEFPWMYQSIHLKPNPNQIMTIRNNSHVASTRVGRIYGTNELDKVLRHYQRTRYKTLNEIDIDTLVLFKHFYNEIMDGKCTPEDIVNKYHPVSITKRIADAMKKIIMSGRRWI